MAHKEVRLN